MYPLRSERLESVLWLAVISGWVIGVLSDRWIGSKDFILDVSAAVSIFNPLKFGFWWEVIAYFTLSVIAVFTLSHIFFGLGGAFFMFSRGMYDNSLIVHLEKTVGNWSISNIPISEVRSVLLISLILTVNLPLCIWASKLGCQRSIYTLWRIRNKPIDPQFGSKPISNLFMIFSASLLVGLIAALVFSGVG